MQSSTDSARREPLADPARLLAEFVDRGRSETVFEELVEGFGALVYSSALRRTENSELAEEVTQNVFCILARKAATLCRHPALLAWIFKTTRFEASKAMRAERRRQQKHDALARHSGTDEVMAASGEENWREAVPLLDQSLDRLPEKDRQIVLQRFFEGRRFREIAASSGTTEAAAKMRVKRALDKLSKLLRARGVTLSGAAIGSALGSELARSAPSAALADLARNALAASASATATTTAANTLQIMSTAKSATATAVAVLALAAAPFAWQESRASRLREDLSGLERQRTELQEKADSNRSAVFALGANAAPARTVRDILSTTERPLSLEDLLSSMMEVMMSQDIVGMLKIFLPIANMSPSDYEQLMSELENYKGNQQTKQMAMQMMAMFAPEQNPRSAIERMIRLGVEPHAYGNLLSRWAIEDADAALAWYNAKLDAGELQARGIHNTPDQVLYGQLVGGMAHKQAARAIDLYARWRMDDPGNANGALWPLARGVGNFIKESGDDAQLRRLIAIDEGQRSSVIRAAVNAAVAQDDFPAAAAFIDRYIDDPMERRSLLVNQASNMRRLPLSERADHLIAHLPQDEAPEAIGELIGHSYWRSGEEEIRQWLDDQPPGAVRDHGLRAAADHFAGNDKLELAEATVAQIGDAELQRQAREQLDSHRRAREQHDGATVEYHTHVEAEVIATEVIEHAQPEAE